MGKEIAGVETAKARDSTRTALIEAGTCILREKGYNHAGLQEILHKSGVPKGSFYHFFTSKEAFGLAIIEADVEAHNAELEGFLGDQSASAIERLRRYFEHKCVSFESIRCREGCLLGNLGQELADQNETFRLRIEQFFSDWRVQLALCLRQAQATGEIDSGLDVDALASFLINSWEGAILQMKIGKSPAPLRTFVSFVFHALLKKPS